MRRRVGDLEQVTRSPPRPGAKRSSTATRFTYRADAWHTLQIHILEELDEKRIVAAEEPPVACSLPIKASAMQREAE